MSLEAPIFAGVQSLLGRADGGGGGNDLFGGRHGSGKCRVYRVPGTYTFTVPNDAPLNANGKVDLFVQVIGAGGAGGNGNSSAGGGGGGGGAYAEKTIKTLSRSSSVTVTVGASGSTTSFGSYVSCTSGSNGADPSASSGGTASGGAGGTASGGDVNIAGVAGNANNTVMLPAAGGGLLSRGKQGVYMAGTTLDFYPPDNDGLLSGGGACFAVGSRLGTLSNGAPGGIGGGGGGGGGDVGGSSSSSSNFSSGGVGGPGCVCVCW